MSLTSKSPRAVVLVALHIGKQTLPDYTHANSPRTFTQPQLFACLVLKTFFRTDYRGIEQRLRDLPELPRVLGLRRVPDHSTMHKAARRLLGKTCTDQLLHATLSLSFNDKDRIDRLAIDSSGFEARHVSRYFVRRRERGFKTRVSGGIWQTTTYRRWPKLAVAVDCDTHMIASLATLRGPSPDVKHIVSVVADAWRTWAIGTVYADAGYDAEHVHELLREDLGTASLIPPKIGRPTKKLPSGRWRRWMALNLTNTDYGQRWQVETVFSMIKRNLGESVNATNYHSQCRALRLLAITHNIMILLRSMSFSTEHVGYRFWGAYLRTGVTLGPFMVNHWVTPCTTAGQGTTGHAQWDGPARPGMKRCTHTVCAWALAVRIG